VSDHFDSEEALESKGFGGSSAIPSLDVSLYEFPRALVVLVVFSCYFHIQFFSGLSVLSPLYAYSMIFHDIPGSCSGAGFEVTEMDTKEVSKKDRHTVPWTGQDRLHSRHQLTPLVLIFV